MAMAIHQNEKFQYDEWPWPFAVWEKSESTNGQNLKLAIHFEIGHSPILAIRRSGVIFLAHGLGKIPGSKHKCLKILWALIFCISLTIFFIQCVELIKDYRKWPVTMSMRVVNQQNSGMHFEIDQMVLGTNL